MVHRNQHSPYAYVSLQSTSFGTRWLTLYLHESKQSKVTLEKSTIVDPVSCQSSSSFKPSCGKRIKVSQIDTLTILVLIRGLFFSEVSICERQFLVSSLLHSKLSKFIVPQLGQGPSTNLLDRKSLRLGIVNFLDSRLRCCSSSTRSPSSTRIQRFCALYILLSSRLRSMTT